MATKKSNRTKKSSLIGHESNIKAVLAFFVLMVAFAVFLLFNYNKDLLIGSPSLRFFVILVAALFALLVGLMFLVNPQKKR